MLEGYLWTRVRDERCPVREHAGVNKSETWRSRITGNATPVINSANSYLLVHIKGSVFVTMSQSHIAI